MGASILVVDDEQADLRLMELVLGKLGHRMLAAHNAAEALELVVRERVDLVVLDVRMPVRDGYDAANDIRAVLGDAAPPIVCLTVLAGRRDEPARLHLVFDATIAKPLDVGAFASRIDPYLPVDRRSLPLPAPWPARST